MISLPKSALWYARYGWQVFPLRPKSKTPFAGLGVYNATRDKAQIVKWWQQWPDANIGLHCGGSNLLALDIDLYKNTYAGDKLLSHLDEETTTNLTGNGGAHLLYSIPSDVKYGNGRGDLPVGVDIRSWGGYIVLPPSIHPTGRRYTWELGYGPHETKPLPLPDTLRRILKTQTRRILGPPDAFAVTIARKLVLALVEQLEIAAEEHEYMSVGRKWILKPCPFQGTDEHIEDTGSYIVIFPDGHIAAGCHHERCRQILKEANMLGWKWLNRKVYTYVEQ